MGQTAPMETMEKHPARSWVDCSRAFGEGVHEICFRCPPRANLERNLPTQSAGKARGVSLEEESQPEKACSSLCQRALPNLQAPWFPHREGRSRRALSRSPPSPPSPRRIEIRGRNLRDLPPKVPLRKYISAAIVTNDQSLIPENRASQIESSGTRTSRRPVVEQGATLASPKVVAYLESARPSAA